MPATAGEVLEAARNRLAALSAHPRRDAELLLAHALGCDPIYLFAHPERLLSPAEEAHVENFLVRRMADEPMQYITGEQEFFGLIFEVTPDVLIPRPETEHLVEAVLERIDPGAHARIIDVGTGSGAIAIALAHVLPRAQVKAVDVSLAALAVARRNAQRHGVAGRITFQQSDLLAAIDEKDFDAIVSNPPYIANAEVLEPQVSNYEPHSALYAGPTGLEVYERLIPQAGERLKPKGWLMLEMGYGQGPALLKFLLNWTNTTIQDDLQGIPRIVSTQNPRL